MAQYYHLNVYKKSFDFLVKVTQLTSRFQRDFRHTLGEKLNNGTIELIVLIYKANSAQDMGERVNYIKELLEKLQYINIILRLSCELHNISQERFAELALMSQEIEKQLNGWLSHSSKVFADKNTSL